MHVHAGQSSWAINALLRGIWRNPAAGPVGLVVPPTYTGVCRMRLVPRSSDATMTGYERVYP